MAPRESRQRCNSSALATAIRMTGQIGNTLARNFCSLEKLIPLRRLIIHFVLVREPRRHQDGGAQSGCFDDIGGPAIRRTIRADLVTVTCAKSAWNFVVNRNVCTNILLVVTCALVVGFSSGVAAQSTRGRCIAHQAQSLATNRPKKARRPQTGERLSPRRLPWAGKFTKLLTNLRNSGFDLEAKYRANDPELRQPQKR